MNPISLPDVALPLAASGQTSQPPGPLCPFGPCEGKGWYYRFDENRYRFVVNCLCRDPKRRSDVLRASGMPARFFGATLTRPGAEPFVIWGDARNRKTLQEARAWAARYVARFQAQGNAPSPNRKGLLIYGPSGCGKTRLAASIAVDLLHAQLRTLRFVDAAKLPGHIARTIQEGGHEAQCFDPLIATSLLILDNAQPPEHHPDRFLAKLGHLLEPRLEAGRPTLVTMTLPVWDLADSIGQRWASRFLDYCHGLFVPAQDYRLAHRRRPGTSEPTQGKEST